MANTHNNLPRFSTAKTHSWMKRGTVPRSRSHSSDSDEPKTTSETNTKFASTLIAWSLTLSLIIPVVLHISTMKGTARLQYITTPTALHLELPHRYQCTYELAHQTACLTNSIQLQVYTKAAYSFHLQGRQTSRPGLGLEAKFYWPRPWPWSRLSGLGLELNEAKAEACECEPVR